ncbi:MAG: flagellar biosynthetic protein FliR [Candidatus Eisenbacteria bacterium]|uniref:Flagellar biosynthetic protein FliR n=1 Tax=Eiseniibacteriota bacterium TaxID=2212470 RepID=A0A956RR09_UNCEI|nr:flagellar biosynthetic protein FliR [Candidatus Eisenbacteria bacterium]
MYGVDQISTFLLVTVRCLSFFAIGPLFTHQKVPPQMQALAGVATAVALFPTVPPAHWVLETSLFGFALVIAREVLLGGLLGTVAGALFAGVQFAGHLAGIQMGFSVAQVFDPNNNEQMPLVGRLQELFAALLFLLLDGHHILLSALSVSLQKVPPGHLPAPPALLASVTMVGSAVFLLAIQVGGPVVAALFLTDAALGFVARAVPQMNIFLVGLPVKIAGGLALLAVTAPLFGAAIGPYTRALEGQLLALLAGM